MKQRCKSIVSNVPSYKVAALIPTCKLNMNQVVKSSLATFYFFDSLSFGRPGYKNCIITL
jgi:hypothetical protein